MLVNDDIQNCDCCCHRSTTVRDSGDANSWSCPSGLHRTSAFNSRVHWDCCLTCNTWRHRSTMYMRPVGADAVAWAVNRSVGLSPSWALQKRVNRSRCRLGCGHELDQGTMCWMGSRYPQRQWAILKGEWWPIGKYGLSAVSSAKRQYTDRHAVWDAESSRNCV